MIYWKEISPTTKAPHLHGYFRGNLIYRKTLSADCTFVHSTKGLICIWSYLLSSKGTEEDNYNYCSKSVFFFWWKCKNKKDKNIFSHYSIGTNDTRHSDDYENEDATFLEKYQTPKRGHEYKSYKDEEAAHVDMEKIKKPEDNRN